MLALSRRPRETLVLITNEGKVTIHIDETSDKQVKLSCDAPRSITILRDVMPVQEPQLPEPGKTGKAKKRRFFLGF